MIPYTLIRSGRRTLSVEVTREGQVVVRAPMRCSHAAVERFVTQHQDWIEKHLEKQRLRFENYREPTEEEKQVLIEKAKQLLPQRVAYYAAIMGVEPTGITITGAQKRFGSCSGKNRICFSWRLMEYPSEAIDYVVVHELAHIVHKNHGQAFYTLIESILPDYRQRMKLLKR